MKYLFRGGTVVSGRGTRRADVLVEDEKILRVARSISAPEATVIDVEGQLLLPGFIDAHTHFDLDVCSTTTADDFFSGSRSALRGGTTTVIDFACPNKGESLHYGLDLWHRKADGRTFCDYGFHMTIDDWNPGIEAEIDDMYAAGISSFKMYMTYPAMMIPEGDMYNALLRLKEVGGIAGVHCENSGIIDALIAKAKAANVPNDNIDRIIKKAAGEGNNDNFENVTYEGYGPSGVAVIVEALTDNRNRTAADVRHAFDKFGGNLGTTGCVSFMFNKKGVIAIEREGLDEDTVMSDALEAGAADFAADEDVFSISTEPDDFSGVREDLEKKGYEFVSADVEMVPDTYTTITDEDTIVKMQKMLDLLEDNDDVQNVWHNWENPDEDEEED